MSRRIAVVLGTRPEAIKLAPLLRAARHRPSLEPVAIATGQHRQLVEQVAEVFELRFEHDLGIMTEGQRLEQLLERIGSTLPPVLRPLRPELLVVQGDTCSAALAAQVAFYQRIPVCHVEAGLRTHDRWRPFPEEVNRRLITQIASLHFAPSEGAAANLQREGVDPETVWVTGNTGIDALQMVLAAEAGSERHGASPLLVTVHRRESFGAPLERICGAIRSIARELPEVSIKVLVHPNPQVRTTLLRELAGVPQVELTEPLRYDRFCRLLASARLVLTDSGGLQEEAPALGIPVLCLREVTERHEAVAAGTVRLVGTDPGRIMSAVRELLTQPEAYQRMARAVNPYGDGTAAEQILDVIEGWRPPCAQPHSQLGCEPPRPAPSIHRQI